MEITNYIKVTNDGDSIIEVHRRPIEFFVESITFNDGFTSSKRFIRYKDNIKNMINTYLKNTFSVYEEVDDNLKLTKVPEFTKILIYPYYFIQGLKNYFAYKSKHFNNINNIFNKLDPTLIPHLSKYSLLWENELYLYNTLNDKYDTNILKYLNDYLDNKINLNIPSIEDVIESEFTEVCLNIIREKELLDDINDSNWFRNCQIKDEFELFNFMRRFTTALYISIENIIKYIVDTYRTNEESLLSQNNSLKQSELKAQEKLKKTESEFNNKIKNLQNKLDKANKKNSELTIKISTIKQACEKQYKTDIYNANKEVKDIKDNYNRLNEKYQSALERIKMLEDILEELENTQVENNEIEISKDFFDKRFVFVRDTFAKDYSTILELTKRFSNSIFTNGISKDIKAQNIDGVVFLTHFEHHNHYYKAKDVCNNMNIPYVHCDSTNIDKICKTIYMIFEKGNK